MTFGEQLRQLREDQGLGLRELARRSGLALSHLQYLEKDVKRPGDPTLKRLAPHLGVPVNQLVTLRDESKAETDLTLLLREEAGDLTPKQRERLLEIAQDVLGESGSDH